MAELVLLTMTLAAILYALFGGADFGAGLIDALMPRQHRHVIDVAIAPVWEANHVWLILVVVLAFVGFPQAYATVSQLLHIPLALMLLGIVARGSAFTFRHYDPEPGRVEPWYTAAFRLGSLLTPLCLGFVVAAISHGRLTTHLQAGFYAVYVAPWNTGFGWSLGAFVCALFAFEGAALLAAERGRRAEPLPYLRLARRMHACMLLAAVAVGLTAYLEGAAWLAALIASPLALTLLGAALLLAPLVAHAFERGHPVLLRLLTGAQLLALTTGYFAAQFPVLVRLREGDLHFAEVAAPPATLRGMIWALAVGLLLIVPALVYLVRKAKGAAAREG